MATGSFDIILLKYLKESEDLIKAESKDSAEAEDRIRALRAGFGVGLELVRRLRNDED